MEMSRLQHQHHVAPLTMPQISVDNAPPSSGSSRSNSSDRDEQTPFSAGVFTDNDSGLFSDGPLSTPLLSPNLETRSLDYSSKQRQLPSQPRSMPILSRSKKSTSRSAGTRYRSVSGSKAEDHVIRTAKRVVYTAGRPPWYGADGEVRTEPFVVGICGGSASGKTTVAQRIIESLDIPWVTLLSLDSFYKVLNEEQHEKALRNEYDFDHPSAFDFEMCFHTLQRLKEGRKVEVPVYNFTTHSREKHSKTLYGADVIIFEGIMSFHNADILSMMDLKIFVDADSDIRLGRRLKRDILDRGRDIEGVLKQYCAFVKPSYDNFIAPSMRHADIIIPRGGENTVAVELIVRHISKKLQERGMHPRCQLATRESFKNQPLPASLKLLRQTHQVKGCHTFIRNSLTSRDEFIFYAKRLMRLLIEHSLSLLPYGPHTVDTPQGVDYVGVQRQWDKICGVSIVRAGETIESALREVVKDCKMGKILIQTNPDSQEPELYYLRLPKDISQYNVLLMDATVATGAAAMMAIRVLLDHDVPEQNIMLLSLLMAATGVHSIAYAFPQVKLLTTAVDPELSKNYFILPGLGNFGDRFFGTCMSASDSESGEE